MKTSKIIFLTLLSLNITYVKNATSAEKQERFSLSEVCKAGLSTVYGRDIDIMESQSVSDKISRIKYIRNQDGKSFSYLCRKETLSRLSIFDENLTDARWYGADLADSQIFFSTTNDVLTIKDVNNGEVLKTNIYTKNDFIPMTKKTKEDAGGINNWLNKYGHEKSKEWRVKYIESIQTMNKPVNVYMLRFNTSDKKLLTLPNADKDSTAYDKNILRITKWQDFFCTQELRSYMIENKIDMIHSEISSNKKMQFIATCLLNK
ncbi:hypothetical protein L9H26_08125 [Morganella psychrotolerans]|uniref:Uncharacterized protein n=1 Tax=Morganella psychrotolerans TaxID=368603 RepID=A0A5M9RB95_9GAMM|nr:hypothetical protein [Morganella psychrotolerans]KAA8716715.1 hypothetical protein F4V73_02220 [Morganella psychrotolerans]